MVLSFCRSPGRNYALKFAVPPKLDTIRPGCGSSMRRDLSSKTRTTCSYFFGFLFASRVFRTQAARWGRAPSEGAWECRRFQWGSSIRPLTDSLSTDWNQLVTLSARRTDAIFPGDQNPADGSAVS